MIILLLEIFEFLIWMIAWEMLSCSGTLEGLKHKPNYEKLLENPLHRFSGLYLEQCPPLLVRMQLFNNGEPIGLPVTTSYKAFTKRYK